MDQSRFEELATAFMVIGMDIMTHTESADLHEEVRFYDEIADRWHEALGATCVEAPEVGLGKDDFPPCPRCELGWSSYESGDPLYSQN